MKLERRSCLLADLLAGQKTGIRSDERRNAENSKRLSPASMAIRLPWPPDPTPTTTSAVVVGSGGRRADRWGELSWKWCVRLNNRVGGAVGKEGEEVGENMSGGDEESGSTEGK